MTQTTTQTTQRKDIHQLVTDRIVQQLEQGNIPWYKPWQGEGATLELPYNKVSQNHYNGINNLLLWCTAHEKQFASPEWATFKQWSENKETIRKGEKGTMIVYYDFLEKEVEGQEELQKIPFLKTYHVFNRCQLESYKGKDLNSPDSAVKKEPLITRLQPVDAFVENTKAIIQHGGERAYFSPSEDIIQMPFQQSFVDTPGCSATEGYYATMMHELVHWSGAKPRLNRLDNTNGSHDTKAQRYAKEELIAELGAAFLCAEFGINTIEKTNHAAYIASWLEALKNDKGLIIPAANQASKAVRYLKEMKPG